jgi:hypothetical protein
VFQPNSRYYTIETAEYVDGDGRTVRYVRRRFIPRAPSVPLAEHRVVAGDRLDRVTARYLADPERFWQVADANRVEHADDVTAEVGTVAIIPMPNLTSP